MRNALCLLAAAAIVAPATATACGGFFCSASPVDQSAERILFVQETEDTWSAYVDIAYQGDSDAFAWIVPVPAPPEALDTWHGLAFNALDLVTQPVFEGGWNGCFGLEDADGGGPPNAGGGEVEVFAQERVGPFDTATIGSDDPRALVEWLRTNGYRILPDMEPFIALYTAEGMKFVALKLAPEEDVDSIEPIKMTYKAAGPMVPLRLTAVAAQLEMGVKVWILADGRYGPGNVPAVEIADTDLVRDPFTSQVNYPQLVARAIDAADGHGFITELATGTGPLAQRVRESNVPDRIGQPGIEARDALAELLASKPYITRLYARLSPEEMDIDPMFVPDTGPDVSNVHQVPEMEPVDQCGNWEDEVADFDACAFGACGAAGACARVEQEGWGFRLGCACVEGALGRAMPDSTAPNGIAVACGDARMNFMTPDAMALPQNLAFPDACAGDPCGSSGECLSLNGFQTCRCDVGYVATGLWNEDRTALLTTCVEPVEPPAVAPVELREPNLPYPGRVEPMQPTGPGGTPMEPEDPPPPGMAAPKDSGGCAAAPSPTGAPGLAALALLGLVALRRRR